MVCSCSISGKLCGDCGPRVGTSDCGTWYGLQTDLDSLWSHPDNLTFSRFLESDFRNRRHYTPCSNPQHRTANADIADGAGWTICEPGLRTVNAPMDTA